MKKGLKTKSKFLSLVLRHKPEAAGVALDENGWCDIENLLDGANKSGISITRDELDKIVETNEKKRFRISDDFKMIRANQGHSIKVDLGLTATDPPAILFHGTATRNEESIMSKGIKKMNRHNVHLSPDRDTARKVGMRHGKVLILEIDSRRMREDDFKFYISENEVWLVDEVPAKYIRKEASNRSVDAVPFSTPR